ncbi:MAG: hypothetical protein WBA24_22455 [Geitlerinemataceae cyanobacterium]
MNSHLQQLISTLMQKRFSNIGLTMAILLLGSCGSGEIDFPLSSKTYKNPRFGFESIYPGDWRSTPSPSNLDGRTFYHPRNPDVQISVWAGYQLSSPQSDSLLPNSMENFTTRQGLNGALRVEVGTQTSVLHLTLVDDRVSYHFEGRSPSLSFADYYSLFYDVARQYQIDN